MNTEHASPPPTPTEPDTLLTERDLVRLLGVTRVTLYHWRRRGKFPAPFILGDRMVRWDRETIRQWIRARRRGIGSTVAA